MIVGSESTRLLAELVAIPSQNPMGRLGVDAGAGYYEGRLTAYLENWLNARGIRTERQPVGAGRDNLLAWVEPPGARCRVLFDVHQDTVPADGMSVEPFGAQVEAGRLYGRGACDVKGSLAAMLLAVERLARERPQGAAAVVLACTVDEEYTHTGSSRLAEVAGGMGIGLAVVAEPTRFDVITRHKGAVRWGITATGRACHSSTPRLGDNAIYRMARVVSALEAYAGELESGPGDPVLGPPTLSVGRIEGGVAANVVPDGCRVEIDRRVVPGETPESAQEEVTRWLRSALDPADFEALRIERPWVQMPALREGVGPEVLALIGEVVEAKTGRRPAVGGVPFGTDAGPLGQAGVPCVVLGPGDIAQAHTRDEWVDLGEVEAAVEVYYELVLRLPESLASGAGPAASTLGVTR
ncbi:MAG: acetylornithine deacetylase [Isosphaeraceae bacterium]|jgi:acetylornithine deacetylase|nr:MAG: acetylornithine deacetylase [Isosphaeraceae bacterium]